MDRSTQVFIARSFRAILSVAALLVVFWFFGDVLSWIALAWVFSLIGQPLMRGLGALHIKRYSLGASLRAVFTIGAFYLGFALFVLLLVPPMIHQASNLSKVDPEKFSATIGNWLDEASSKIEKFGLMEAAKKTHPDSITKKTTPNVPPRRQVVNIRIDSVLAQKGDTLTKTNILLNINLDSPQATVLPEKADDDSKNSPPSPTDNLKHQLFSFFSPSRIMGLFGNLVGVVGNFSVGLASVTFMLFFFLRDEDLFVRATLAFVPAKMDEEVRTVISRIRRLLTRYFVGMVLEIAGITLYVWAFLSLLGVPNALLLAFMAALLNTIPYLGPLIGAVFGAVLTVTANLDADFMSVTLPLLIKVILVFWTMQMLDNYFLQPWIFSQSVMAHPMEIFLVIVIGAKFSGVIGMVLAVPVYTVLRVIAAEFLSKFRVVRELTGQMNRKFESKEEANP